MAMAGPMQEDEMEEMEEVEGIEGARSATPLSTFMGSSAFTGVDHHWVRNQFATSSDLVEVR